MPTIKPRINVVVDDDLYARIKAYCAKTGTSSASKAVSDLMLVGLKRFEADTKDFEEFDAPQWRTHYLRAFKAGKSYH